MNDRIYPSIVIRSQAEALELLKQENQQLRTILGNQVRIKDELEQENKQLHNKIDKYKSLEQSLTFIKNRVKQGMTQENINKCAIRLVNSYLKDSDVDE